MDMVYSQAYTTAGLLNSVTVRKCHMDAIESILDPSWGSDAQKWAETVIDPPSANGLFNGALDFLLQVTQDV